MLKKIILASLLVVFPIASCTSDVASQPASSGNTAQFIPVGDPCPFPERIENQRLLDQVLALSPGSSPEEVVQQIAFTPAIPYIQYQNPNRDAGVIVWKGVEGVNDIEIRVEFVDRVMIGSSLGIAAPNSLDVCTWEIGS